MKSLVSLQATERRPEKSYTETATRQRFDWDNTGVSKQAGKADTLKYHPATSPLPWWRQPLLQLAGKPA